LGQPEPVFAHVPMILGTDGKKLSKRHGATAVGDYQDLGILPAAMRNFLALLGWSPGGDREIMPEAEMIAAFSLEGIQSKPAVFDTVKLEWMNGQYLSATSAEDLLAPVERQLAVLGIDGGGRDLRPLIDAVKARSRTILQLAEQVAVRLTGPRGAPDERATALIRKMGPAFQQNLTLVGNALDAVPHDQWTPEMLLDRVRSTAETAGLKLGDAMQPIRVALTGSTVSEPVNELLATVGPEASLARIRAAAAAGA